MATITPAGAGSSATFPYDYAATFATAQSTAHKTVTTTIGTFLKIGDVWFPIKSYPDLFGDAEQLECTDLTDNVRRYVAGLQSNDTLGFTMNYHANLLNTLISYQNAMEAKSCVLYFGENGQYGTFSFDAYVSATVNSGDVNAVREMTLHLVPTTQITLDTGTSVTPGNNSNP